MARRSGHYCWMCGRQRPNEAFSGRGHKQHLCKQCACRPKAERDRIRAEQDLYGFLQQRNISEGNIARARSLSRSDHPEIRQLANLVLQVAAVAPRRRKRSGILYHHHPELYDQLVDLDILEPWDHPSQETDPIDEGYEIPFDFPGDDKLDYMDGSGGDLIDPEPDRQDRDVRHDQELEPPLAPTPSEWNPPIGYFHDDGTEFNPDLMLTPDLCISCRHHDATDAQEEIVCNLTRADQQDDEIFICFAYQPVSADMNREDVLRDLCRQAGVDYPEASDDTEDSAQDIPF